ncbi:HD-GYP domain-containing protein [Paraburkholderia phosphatilytica]|uniref:HD-GYP domain-containing protein n=1 Tax=Paraburkholderia phosphatilytica TaxID=2282883 RepID=UPI000E54C74F|nr:HD-GYP domain-containing protein [Paraburkholderia phosphatilytica]
MITRIPVSALCVGMYIHKLGGSWMNHPFLRTSFLLTDAKDLRAILDAGIGELWIDESKGLAADADAHHAASQDTAQNAPAESTTATTTTAAASPRASSRPSMGMELDRARKLCQLARGQMTGLFRDARLGKTLDAQATLPLVSEITASVQRHPAALLSIARLKSHDDYTYLHSVAVCTMMVALGRQLGMDEQAVRLAGHGGLMHDIGKAMMPLDVLNKPGRLTDHEFDVIKRHPLAGAGMLVDSNAAPEVQDVALHHHEKVDGSGYPHRLAGEDISLLARMGAICDVYDAVTSNRAYKQAWDPAHAMRQMAKWQGHFDKRVFNAFVKTVGIYPVGSLVRLASQRLAVVIEPNPESLLTPKVRAFFSVRSKEPIAMQTIDLSARGANDSIVGPEDAVQWGFERLDDIWLVNPA